MSFTLGAIVLAEETSGRFAPTSALGALRLPFQENETCVPSSLFNPFHGARPMSASAGPRYIFPSLTDLPPFWPIK